MKTLFATAAFALLAGPALATDEDMVTFECPSGTVAQIDHGPAETGLGFNDSDNGERSVGAADRDHAGESGDSQRGYSDPGDGARTVGAADRDHAGESGDSQRGYSDPGTGERTVGGGRIVRCMPTSGQR